MRVDNVFLAGIGTFVPERVTIDEAVERGWYDAALRESSGMISVAVGGDTPAPDMAVSAARDAMKRSDTSPRTSTSSSIHRCSTRAPTSGPPLTTSSTTP